MSRFKEFILPAYLLLCLLIGGSVQGVWANAALQLLALAILAWALLTRDPQPLTRAGRQLLVLAGLLVLLIAIQLAPLPPSVWTALPGREFVAEGLALLGIPLPWMPTSLAPHDTAATATTLLPPLALAVGMMRLRAWSAGWMLGAIVAGAAASILLGILQVTAGDGSWYFYRITNLGTAVGAFANANHFATLLLAAIPVLAGLFAVRWRASDNKQARSLSVALAAAAAAVLLLGILVNASAAVLLLGPAVVAGSALLALRLEPRRVRQGLAAIALLLAIATIALATVGKNLPGWGTNASIETRTTFWSTTLEATQDHLATGTGFGTFEQVYQRYEDPGAVDNWYTNHAHNDYLEIALEGGVPALVLLLLFLLWWLRQAASTWLSNVGSPEQKAAAVASAAILLHSTFDYPLRTAAIAAVMAVCVALLAGAKGASRKASEDDRETARHASL
jgi:O-antigen ligase